MSSVVTKREVTLESRTVLDFFELSVFQSLFALFENVDLTAHCSKVVCELCFGFRSGVSKSSRAWTALPPETDAAAFTLLIPPVNLAIIYREMMIALESFRLQFSSKLLPNLHEESAVWKGSCVSLLQTLRTVPIGSKVYQDTFASFSLSHLRYYLAELSVAYLDCYSAVFDSLSMQTSKVMDSGDTTAAVMFKHSFHFAVCPAIIAGLAIILDTDDVQQRVQTVLLGMDPTVREELATDSWPAQLAQMYRSLPNDFQTLCMARLLLRDDYANSSSASASVWATEDDSAANLRLRLNAIIAKVTARFPGTSHPTRVGRHLSVFVNEQSRS